MRDLRHLWDLTDQVTERTKELSYDERGEEVSARVRQNERDGLYGTADYPMHYKAKYSIEESRFMQALNEVLTEIILKILTENGIKKPENILADLPTYKLYTEYFTRVRNKLFAMVEIGLPGILDDMLKDFKKSRAFLDDIRKDLSSILHNFYDLNKEKLCQV